MESVVTFQNVSFKYQDSPVITNVSFEIGKGEFVGIFGPNGGGKTTLLKLIMGFLEPTKGTVMIEGEPAKERVGKIGYVPQRLAFDKQFPVSVLELVLSGKLSELPWYGRYSSGDKEAAIATLEKVGLKELINEQFGSLSGGQCQRALFARALLSEPEILLLDEPTAGVDPEAEQDIYELLSELKGKMTILMVTHQLKTAVDYVNRALCVQRNVTSLETKELCEHYALGLYHPPMKKGCS